jgi:threonine synthase
MSKPDDAEHLCVSLETAHPAKFPDEIERTIGVTPAVPASLAEIESKPETYPTMSAEYDAFRALLFERFGRR